MLPLFVVGSLVHFGCWGDKMIIYLSSWCQLASQLISLVSVFAVATKRKRQLFLGSTSTLPPLLITPELRFRAVQDRGGMLCLFVASAVWSWLRRARGAVAGPQRRTASPNFLGNNYWVFTKWRCGEVRPSWGIAGRYSKIYIYLQKSARSISEPQQD